MQRKKLLALEINKNRADIPVMQAVVEFQHKDKYVNYTTHEYNYVYDAFIDESTGEKTLIVDMFKPAPGAEFLYRLFIGKNKQGDDKWFIVKSDGTVSESSLPVDYYYRQFYYPFSAETDKVIDDYLADTSSYAKGKGIVKIIAWQKAVRQKRLKDKYQKIKDSISYELAEIRPLPQSVHKWIDNTVMAYSRYMFYDANRKKHTTARCSVCGNEVTINKVRSGDKVTCPVCHKKCTAKPYRKYLNSNGFCNRETIMYLQPFKDTRFCAREFTVVYFYTPGEIKPRIRIKELVRTTCDFDGQKMRVQEQYTYDKNYKGGDWRKDFCRSVNSSLQLYPGTLNKIFKRVKGFNKWHIDYGKIARLCNPIAFEKLYNAVNQVASLNNIIDNGLINLARDVITYTYRCTEFDLAKGSLRKSFGITKDDLKILKQLNPKLYEFKLYKAYKQTGRKIDIEELKEFFAIRSMIGCDVNDMLRILEYSSLRKFCKFFRKWENENCTSQDKDSWWDPRRTFFRDYKDYIENATLLEYDLSNLEVLYPKNFKQAHDLASDIVNDKEFSEGELPQIARQYEKYSNLYSYEDKDFCIMQPRRHNDLKNEGKTLCHCVATYAKKVATEKTIILFIRKMSEKEKPYFTLELNPVTLRIEQCRGFDNCSYPNEVKKFIDKWYKTKIEPMIRSKGKCQTTAA
ncbi:PcfJ domain-containing protein [Ruminococcus sp.]